MFGVAETIAGIRVAGKAPAGIGAAMPGAMAMVGVAVTVGKVGKCPVAGLVEPMVLIMDPVKVTAVATGAAGAGRNGKMTAEGRLPAEAGGDVPKVDVKVATEAVGEEKVQGARIMAEAVQAAAADMVSAVKISIADASVFAVIGVRSFGAGR